MRTVASLKRDKKQLINKYKTGKKLDKKAYSEAVNTKLLETLIELIGHK